MSPAEVDALHSRPSGVPAERGELRRWRPAPRRSGQKYARRRTAVPEYDLAGCMMQPAPEIATPGTLRCPENYFLIGPTATSGTRLAALMPQDDRHYRTLGRALALAPMRQPCRSRCAHRDRPWQAHAVQEPSGAAQHHADRTSRATASTPHSRAGRPARIHPRQSRRPMAANSSPVGCDIFWAAKRKETVPQSPGSMPPSCACTRRAHRPARRDLRQLTDWQVLDATRPPQIQAVCCAANRSPNWTGVRENAGICSRFDRVAGRGPPPAHRRVVLAAHRQ